MITVIIPTLDWERTAGRVESLKATAGLPCEVMPVGDAVGAGFTSTVNTGIAHAQPGDICLLNDDCKPSQDWLAVLKAEMDAHAARKVWFAGPSGPCRTLPQCYGRPGDNRRPRIVPHLSGFCLLIKAEAIEALGGLDPRFIHYGSDVDLQWRARRDHQAASLWVPSVYVQHELHQPRVDWWQRDQSLLKEIWK